MKRVCLVIVLLGLATSLSAQSRRSVLIRAAQPYDALVQDDRTGRRNRHASIQARERALRPKCRNPALAQIERLVARTTSAATSMIPLPEIDRPARRRASRAKPKQTTWCSLDAPGVAVVPANYTFNATLTNVAPLHAAGQIGTGIVIAVIDSGYRPIMQHVAPSRLISPGPEPGAWRHRTAGDQRPERSRTARSCRAWPRRTSRSASARLNRFVVVAEHYGAAIVGPPCAATARLVPMVGSAPGASIFPIKVFPAAGGGAPTSRVIAAMEAAIDLRQKFDAGEPDGLNIQVANLSLGGPTNAAARELDDEAVEALINADIVPVDRCRQRGLLVGDHRIAGHVVCGAHGRRRERVHQHEQIFRAQFSAPCGAARRWRRCSRARRRGARTRTCRSRSSARAARRTTAASIPTSSPTDRSTSARAAAAPTTVNFGSGTSYSTPTVSGIAAVLRQAVPDGDRAAGAQRDHQVG